MATVFTASAGWLDGKLVRDVRLAVSDAGEVLPEAPPGAAEVRLGHKLLLPGFVNGHSHAFQRAIRGRTEFLAPGHERDDFWSWREAMYAAAESLTPEQLYAVSKQALHALVRVLALENRGSVRVNAVLPGTIDTPANRDAMKSADTRAWTSPLAIARVVVFLLSSESAPVTGALVPVDAPA